MKLRFNTTRKCWEVRFTQSGSEDVWSDWEPITRTDVLRLIEKGFSFEYYPRNGR